MTIAGKGGRPSGLPKTGGRKKGTPNKATVELAERLHELGCDPLSVIATVCMNNRLSAELRMRAAFELLSYRYPKRRPIEGVSSQPPTYEVKTIVEATPANGAPTDDGDGA
jgi:hypothetical protein